MADLTLNELKQRLLDTKSLWTVRENSVTAMSLEARIGLLGAKTETLEKVSVVAGAAPQNFSLPSAVDWRNRNGNHITSVKDQGHCGSCVSFATVAVTESMASIEKGRSLDLSEADQHFCSSHGANCGGWNPSDAFNQIKSRGVADEACFPYASAFPGNDIHCSDASNPGDHYCRITCHPCGDRNLRLVSVTSVHQLNNVEEDKNYLATTGPIACCFDVYDDFYPLHDNVYHHIAGILRGSHCVEIIGYSDPEGCWICKNSWDTTFGVNGIFKIGYGECKIDEYRKYGVTGVLLPEMRNVLHASWVHGNALTVETPANLSSNMHFGWGTDVQVMPGKGSWFHISIPTPVIEATGRTDIQRLFVLFRSTFGSIKNIHIYDGAFKIQEMNGLNLSGDHLIALDSSNIFNLTVPHTVIWGMSISFFFSADAGASPGHLIVGSAGGDFFD